MTPFLAHFLPHKEHKKRAKLLLHPALFTYILFIFFAILASHFVSARFPKVLGFASNINTEDLLYYTNKARVENSEPELKFNAILSSAAYEKAEDMFRKDYWAHISPTGKEPWDFIVDNNYEYIYAGENLARDFNNSSSVVQAWLKSPSHRDNLLSSNYEDIGFAVVNGVLDGYETTLVVQMFGKSRYPEYTASIEPEKEASIQAVSIQKKEAVSIPVSKEQKGEILPAIDIFSVSRGISLSLGAFLTLLLALDMWYVGRNSILRLTGNTLAHLIFLGLALIGIWYANAGVVL